MDIYNLVSFAGIFVLLGFACVLGYFGQPHILVRFMSAKSLDELNESMTIAITWVLLPIV